MSGFGLGRGGCLRCRYKEGLSKSFREESLCVE